MGLIAFCLAVHLGEGNSDFKSSTAFRLTLVSERLILVLQYNAYPVALWVNLGWRKASGGVTIKTPRFSNILRLFASFRKGIRPLKFFAKS